jgi:phage tail sheath gpL-like
VRRAARRRARRAAAAAAAAAAPPIARDPAAPCQPAAMRTRTANKYSMQRAQRGRPLALWGHSRFGATTTLASS